MTVIITKIFASNLVALFFALVIDSKLTIETKFAPIFNGWGYASIASVPAYIIYLIWFL